jgi:DNA-binding MarR family transcriptional regulator
MSSLELPDKPLIGALLRLPAQAVHRRIIAGLNASGFRDLRLPHMGVLQYPGPDGCRPGELAERSLMSKQAMNQLLKSLERLGYLRRRDAEEGGRARVVYFTRRGHQAWARIHEILAEVEAEWRGTLGEKSFGQLKKLLCQVWTSDLVP